MKTSTFFLEMKKVTNCTLKISFDYSVNRYKDFYEIILNREPTEDVKDMCEKNGFSVKKNILHINEGGEMVSKTIWEVKPVDANDIEYVEA